MHSGLDILGRRAANELAGDDWLHGSEEEAEDPLVHDPPAGVLWVGDIHDSIAGALLDGLCWGHSSAVKMVIKAEAGESWHGEPLPQHEVVGIEANGHAG
jgi:hypothetical protein